VERGDLESSIVPCRQLLLECSFLNGFKTTALSEGDLVMEKRRLGRGLDALLVSTENGSATEAAEQAQVSIERIEQNPYQPRKAFDEDELASLQESIRTHGILQPLVVRSVGDHYQLIAGERRLRAAQAAGFSQVPVRVVDFNDQQVLEAALAENIQRTDLNPIEKAQGFKDYLDRFGVNHEKLAERLGLARTTITNLVGLLDLEPEVQEAVRLNQVTLGHAKILKGLKNREKQIGLCKQIIARGLSVHATEALLKQGKQEASSASARETPEKTAHVMALEDEIRQRLSTRVEIRLREQEKGQFIIGFDSNDDFERVLEVLRR
jgi:ParB family chromosome partitioning protein